MRYTNRRIRRIHTLLLVSNNLVTLGYNFVVFIVGYNGIHCGGNNCRIECVYGWRSGSQELLKYELVGFKHAWSICHILPVTHTCAAYLLYLTRQLVDHRPLKLVDRQEFISLLTCQASRVYRYVSSGHAGYRSVLLPTHV